MSPTSFRPEAQLTDVGSFSYLRRPDGLEDWTAQINIQPMGKPTMTQASKHTKPVAVYYLTKYCPTIRAAFNRVAQFVRCEEIVVRAYFQTEDESLIGKRYNLGKPDATNILKGVEDALLIDDSRNDVSCKRLFGYETCLHVALYGVEY